MPNRQYAISVCMATYNGEKYLDQQLKSILAQLQDNDEVIISDDGSIDGTLAIVDSFHDSRIKLYHHNGHDYTRNFEFALGKATGKYIFLCDQDDYWMPSKVEDVCDYFENGKYDLVVTDASVSDGDLNIITPSYFEANNIQQGFIKNWIATRYIGSCMALNRRMLDAALPIPGESKYIAHDYWMACLGEAYFKVGLLNKSLMIYRRHEGTTSTGTNEKSKNSVGFRIYKRFYTLHYLTKRKNKMHKT
jgi:glycosyltransferase involved in cell wall biosynthesis